MEPKEKRVRRGSAARSRKSSSQRAVEISIQKITVCLWLFLGSFVVTGLIELWVVVPVHSSSDLLALQLNPKDLCPSTAQDATAKTEVLENLQRDSYYLVPAYTLLFVSLGLAIFSGQNSIWIYGMGIILLTIFAASSDLLENHYLESCLDGNYLAASLARRWSLRKWQFLSFATVTAAPLFLVRNDWTQKIGYILAALGLPGLLLLVPFNFAYPVVRYVLLPLLGLGLALMLVTFVGDLMNPQSRTAHWR
jgi:hypothetical protein